MASPASADAGAPRDAAPASRDAMVADASPTETTRAAPTLGEARATAIEVCMPRGQQAYLARLRCAAAAVTYERLGQDGYRHPRVGEQDYRLSAEQVRTRRALAADEKDLHPVDVFAVRCAAGAVRRLYFDMYHCGEGAQTAEAPVGFTLAPAPAPTAADAAPAAPSPKK